MNKTTDDNHVTASWNDNDTIVVNAEYKEIFLRIS